MRHQISAAVVLGVFTISSRQVELDYTRVDRCQTRWVACGKGPVGGERLLVCDASSRSRCFNIFSIAPGLSMLAMIFNLIPQMRQQHEALTVA